MNTNALWATVGSAMLIVSPLAWSQSTGGQAGAARGTTTQTATTQGTTSQSTPASDQQSSASPSQPTPATEQNPSATPSQPDASAAQVDDAEQPDSMQNRANDAVPRRLAEGGMDTDEPGNTRDCTKLRGLEKAECERRDNARDDLPAGVTSTQKNY